MKRFLLLFLMIISFSCYAQRDWRESLDTTYISLRNQIADAYGVDSTIAGDIADSLIQSALTNYLTATLTRTTMGDSLLNYPKIYFTEGTSQYGIAVFYTASGRYITSVPITIDPTSVEGLFYLDMNNNILSNVSSIDANTVNVGGRNVENIIITGDSINQVQINSNSILLGIALDSLQKIVDWVSGFLPLIGGLDAPVLTSVTADNDSALIRLVLSSDINADSTIIQRGLSPSSFSNIDTVDELITNYTDNTTLGNTNYYYRLVSYNTIATSSYSSVLNATTIDTASSQEVVADYYLATAGNDSYDGLTPATAWKTLVKLNSVTLSDRDSDGDTIVAFNGGDRFSDASLTAKAHVKYMSYGTGRAILGDSTSTLTTNPMISINVEGAYFYNLKIYGFKSATKVIEYSLGDFTIDSCEIIGGQDFHKNSWTYGIYQSNHSVNGADDVRITKSKIHGIGFAAIYLAFPYNWDVSYNEFYDLWMYVGTSDWGGCAMAYATTIDDNGEEWDCNYTVNVHHNKIFDFEYATFAIPSRGIVEYNEIFQNLDERVFFGGCKHGDVGKIWDGYRMGQIFRYNYVHDIYIFGQAGYSYSRPSEAQFLSKTPNVSTTNNGTDHPIYLGGGSPVVYGTNFGDAVGEAPENLTGGQGYGNFWIHNNIFYNCTKGIYDRGTNYYNGTTTQLPYDSTKASYFLNNTIVNCGIWTYGTPYGSLSFVHAAGQSPSKSMNNIYHFGDADGSTAIYFWEKDSYSHNDIFITPLTGYHYGIPDLGDNFAITTNYSADDLSILGQQYAVNQSSIWNDTSSTIFCSTIGLSGAYIPDVRIKVSSSADNQGTAYGTLGDNYTINSVLNVWSDTHSLGEDPSGRSFAYDIFGTLRTRNIIGAVKRVGD